ncbi:MAG: hypothetical protein SOX46_07620 [Clostridiaceae bacterium]|nr:hypothetical protein [Clostridium porci]MDY3231426.1 hypothetical protein [Clostridiaceae bacterium]
MKLFDADAFSQQVAENYPVKKANAKSAFGRNRPICTRACARI